MEHRGWKGSHHHRRERPHVGRVSELARIVDAVRGPGGRGAIVAGVAGVGKSHLLELASTRLLPEGWAALRARGDPARSSPFAAMGELLEPLPQPDRLAVRLRRGLDQLVERAAPHRPLLVADDLHAFDPASATLVHHAVLDGRVRLVGTVRNGAAAPDAVTALWKDDVVERLDLAPLTREEADELVERLLNGPVDAATRAQLWQWFEGNPLLLTEAVALARERGTWRHSAGLWRLAHDADQPVGSPTLAAILADRMSDVPDGVADVVDAVALAGHLPLAVLDRLGGRRALSSAERKRLTRVHVEPSGRVVTLDHPLYAELRRAEMDEARRTDLRERLLDAFERLDGVAPADVPLVALWYVESGRTGGHVAALLAHAADAAWKNDDPRTAARLARRARELRPDDHTGLVLIHALSRLGQGDELRDVAGEVARTAATVAVRAEAVMHHALFLFQFANRPAAAEALLTEAAAGIEDGQWQNALMQQVAIFRLQRGDLVGAEELAQPLLDCGDTATAADAAAVMSPIRLMQGQVGEALALAEKGLSLAAALDHEAAADILHLGEHMFHQIGAWVEADKLREADDLAQVAISMLDDQVDPFARAFVAFQVGRIARLRGRPLTAARWFREAVVGFEAIHRQGFVAWALAGLADVQAQVGDVDGARESVAQCLRHDDHPIRLAAGEVARALAWERVATGRLDAAAVALEDAAQRSLSAHEVLHAAHAFHDLVRIGRADQAAQALHDLAQRSDGLLLATFARHAAATVAADIDELEAVADRFSTMGCDLHAAEAWTQAAQLTHASGLARRSVAAHRAALDCRRHCEGARTPLLAVPTRLADLSRREREVAHLARSGMRRREIAEHLVISPRTVDSHLQRIYRKLGVENQRGLRVALADEPATLRSRDLRR